jgi:hypothetical protein
MLKLHTSTKNYDQTGLTEALANSKGAAPIVFRFLSSRLSESTAELAKDAEAACVFVNDTVRIFHCFIEMLGLWTFT